MKDEPGESRVVSIVSRRKVVESKSANLGRSCGMPCHLSGICCCLCSPSLLPFLDKTCGTDPFYDLFRIYVVLLVHSRWTTDAHGSLSNGGSLLLWRITDCSGSVPVSRRTI